MMCDGKKAARYTAPHFHLPIHVLSSHPLFCFSHPLEGINSDSDSSPSPGVEPMGLFWSLDPAPGEPSGLRLLKRDASKAVTAHLTVLDTDGHVIAQDAIQRTFISPGMTRIPVDEDGLMGSLFVPPGYTITTKWFIN
mgnify:CR=1 FL=1